MSFVSDVLGVLLTVAETAAATTSPKFSDVKIGVPQPRGRCVRIWWAGEVIPAPQMNDARYSLDHELVGHRFGIAAFEPLAGLDEDPAAAAIARLAAFAGALRSGINADRTLGGKSMSVEPEPSPLEFVSVGGALHAFTGTELVAGLDEYQIGDGS